MKERQTIMLALFVTLGAVLVTGLIPIPVIEEADARTVICSDGKIVHAYEVKDGQQGEIKSKGKRSGQGGGGIDT